jgi:hypothetical protein
MTPLPVALRLPPVSKAAADDEARTLVMFVGGLATDP